MSQPVLKCKGRVTSGFTEYLIAQFLKATFTITGRVQFSV